MSETIDLTNALRSVLELQKDYSASKSAAMDRRRELVEKAIPRVLQETADAHNFKVEGSAHAGNNNRVPWVRLFRPELSPTAQQGWYAVLLFAADGSSVFVSVNQGTMDFAQGQGKRKDPMGILARSLQARDRLEASGIDLYGLTSTILLHDKGLGRNYERGNVLAMEYRRDDLPPENVIYPGLRRILALLEYLYGAEANTDLDEGAEPLDTAPAEQLEAIVGELERRATGHVVGTLQVFRRGRMGRRIQPGAQPPAIFGKVQPGTYGPYAYHKGGRSELQFNIGIEPEGQQLRIGVAFSFESSQDVQYPELEQALLPKVAAFNDYLRANFEHLADLRMWYERNNVRVGPDEIPSAIPFDRIERGAFIFFGCRQQLADLDYECVISVMDRLFPLYLYIETVLSPNPMPAEFGTRFTFAPKPWKDRAAQTILQPTQRALDVLLRHNTLQKLLHTSLVLRFGEDSVDYEVECHSETRADVVVKARDEYWFYEIKTAGSPRLCIREAIGQLLEYAYWPGAPQVSRLIVVGSQPIDPEAQSYLRSLTARFSLPIEYEHILCDTA